MKYSIYNSENHYYIQGSEYNEGVYEVEEGVRYHGFKISKVDSESVVLTLDSGENVVLNSGRWLHFEDLETTTYEIYGDEYEDTTGSIVDAALGVNATTVHFDKTLIFSPNHDYLICARKKGVNGNPDSRVAVILIGENSNPLTDRVVSHAKSIFMEEYKSWLNGEEGALSFFEPHELRCDGHGTTDYATGYVLSRMYDYCIEYAVAEVFMDSYDLSVSDEELGQMLTDFYRQLPIVVSFLSGDGGLIFSRAECMPNAGRSCFFADDSVAAFRGGECGMETALYDLDILRNDKYNMLITYLGELTEDEVKDIHKEIINKIVAEESLDGYLEGLDIPICVQYNSAHYRRLADTVKNDTGRSATIRIEFTERGHNPKSERVHRDLATTVNMRAGYLSLYDNLCDENGDHYPRRYDYIKLETVGEDYIDVWLPSFFGSFKSEARRHEEGEPHRIKRGEPLVLADSREVTCHKYKWSSTLTIALL